jgi:hypothetical protein
MIWKQKALQGKLLEELRKIKLSPSQNSWCQDSNRTYPKHNVEPQEPASAWSVHCRFFIIILDCEAIGTAATPVLLWQPRVIVKMFVEKQMECRLAGETEVLGENLPQRHIVHHKIPHDQTRLWTRAAAVGSRRLTARAMARPNHRLLRNQSCRALL